MNEEYKYCSILESSPIEFEHKEEIEAITQKQNTKGDKYMYINAE